ncbi:hypothetical protein QBC45DRAFT_413181 [Copromyces sp. CBS 386.78]|nr:hypothetical protein QBC45DRAFT_413181 [Copromyces sp. CBS 386.78]
MFSGAFSYHSPFSFTLLAPIPIHPFSLLRAISCFWEYRVQWERNCTQPLLCSAGLSACPIWLLSFSLPSYPVWVWWFMMTPSLFRNIKRCKFMPPPLSLLWLASSTNQPPTCPL